MTRSDEPRSAVSIGFEWASRVSTVGLEFVVPTLIGVWLDSRWGTSPLATLAGTLLGFTLMIIHLLRIVRERSGG
jgi:ATP synthase protein I